MTCATTTLTAEPQVGLNIVRLMEKGRAAQTARYDEAVSLAREVLAPIADELEGFDEPCEVLGGGMGSMPTVRWKVWTPEIGRFEVACDGYSVFLNDCFISGKDETKLGEVLLYIREQNAEKKR